MNLDNLGVSASKIGESAQRVIDRACEEVKRRQHRLLTNEHIFIAFMQVQWDIFNDIMHEVGLNPHIVLQAIEDRLNRIKSFPGSEIEIEPSVEVAMKISLHHAARAGHKTIESVDIFNAILEEKKGISAVVLRNHGIEPEVLISRSNKLLRDIELREERLERNFKLPAFLKQFGTNLNLLARLDKLPRVFGRDREI